MEISKHPYEAFIPEGADKLIIGTIPPYRFCHRDRESLFATDVNFYYGSKDNYFWNLLSEIFHVSFQYADTEEAIQERKELLVRLNTGITDVVDTCVHVGHRSDDGSLEILGWKDIPALLLQNPGIKELIYTSKFVIRQVNKSCGGRTYHQWDSNKMDGHVRINNIRYRVRVLYSPSPNALRGVTAEKRMERYKAVFVNE